jgi:hypothetical protein
MFKSMFTNVMTGSDDKARWALAYVEFGLSEVLSGIIGSTDPRRRICGIGGTGGRLWYESTTDFRLHP